jgi:magnesium-transporting ATPase (P-type)
MNNITDNMLGSLRRTKPWVRFLSILGFISVVFTLLAAVGMLLGGGALMMQGGEGQDLPPFMPMLMAGVYVLMALLYFFPSLYLFKYASAIAALLENGGSADMEDALARQKSFFKFYGVLMLIMIVVAVLGVIAAIAIPTFMMGTGDLAIPE